jgi:ATP-dependent DNA helicase DinG
MITDRGDNAFTTYQIPLAILALQQGLGRLIRNKRDRGVLVILDSRIHTKSYGKRFLASLPPAPLTSEMADLEQFFAIQS